MATLRGTVWGNGGRLCGRGVEEEMKGMKKDRVREFAVDWQEVSLLSDGGFAGDTQTSPQPIFMICNPPMPPSLVRPFIPPSPSSLLPEPWATWVGCSDLYTSVHVCVLCVWSNEAVPQATFPILQRHYQPIGIPDYQLKDTSQYLSGISCIINWSQPWWL